MRRTLAIAASLVAIAALDSTMARGPAAAEPEVVDCASRIQVTGEAPAAGPGDLRLGTTYLAGLRRTGRRAPPSFFKPEPGERFAPVKAPPVVQTGTSVTLEVPARERGRFRYEIARDATPHATGEAVELRPCAPDAEVAGRPVGPRTPFVGGIHVTGPGCYTLRARPEGGEPVTRRVKLGVKSCR